MKKWGSEWLNIFPKVSVEIESHISLNHSLITLYYPSSKYLLMSKKLTLFITIIQKYSVRPCPCVFVHSSRVSCILQTTSASYMIINNHQIKGDLTLILCRMNKKRVGGRQNIANVIYLSWHCKFKCYYLNI